MSLTEASFITHITIRSQGSVKQLEVYFASHDDVLKFCRENQYIADFPWLKFVSFEGSSLEKIRTFLSPFFNSADGKKQFDTLINQL